MNAYETKFIIADDPAAIQLYNDYSAEVCCGYLLPHLKPHYNILDVGCGPGNITLGLAKLCPHGKTVGVDISKGVVKVAKDRYCRPDAEETSNLSFQVGDAAELSQFPDNHFDLVHAHACLMHFTDKVKVLRAFRRVCKPDGMIAIRDTRAMGRILSLRPDLPDIRDQLSATSKLVQKIEPNTDTSLNAKWAMQAGVLEAGGRIVLTQGVNTFRTALRLTPDQAISRGGYTRERYDCWEKAWDAWESTKDHELVCPALEMLCFLGEKII